MKAVIYDGPHRMHLDDLPRPSPAAGEVLLRVDACGICGSDVHGYTGESGRRTPGQVMGHEFAGTVAEVGAGVDGGLAGRRVAAYNIIGCGRCRHCAAGQEQCCPTRKVVGVNTGLSGAFAEFVCVPERNLADIADAVPAEIALLNEPLAVALHALRHLEGLSGDLVIVGGGTIGQCLVRVAKMLGGWRPIVLEPLADKRAAAERQGAVALPPDPDRLRELLPEGADAAVEAVGVAETVRSAIDAVRPGGTVVLLGNLAKEVSVPLQHLSSNEKRLVGTYGFNLADFREIVAAINAGRFDLAEMVSGTLGLAETPAMFEELASGRRQAIKMVVKP